ncbi:hypothetical protein DMP23_47560 [Amycolatopsis sp. A1MSW2902]|uniref:hypothetical protein n=1 Tax=Amycolatopsis sp. A1MSW2902 TaxID=687413 RepID=UPI00307DE5A7
MADNEEPERSRADKFFSRTGWWYFAAAIVLVVVAGLVWVLLPSGRDSTSGQEPAVSAGPPPLTGDGGWNDTGCAGTSGSAEVPTSGPKVAWRAEDLASIPTSPDYGPTRTVGPVHSCFQHSPTGALMAATVILEGLAAPATATQVANAGMTPGPGRDATIASTSDAKPSALTPIGFSFGACQPDRCQLSLLLTDGAYGQFALSMVWRDRDWKIDGAGGPVQPVASQTMPSGFVPWGPNS